MRACLLPAALLLAGGSLHGVRFTFDGTESRSWKLRGTVTCASRTT
ncbi:MAG TPA: hypothetical protein VFU46_04425 [Gemmatimonadales bacterium]|nr:hypothetical protein [Gemmatimonadales bacterium]